MSDFKSPFDRDMYHAAKLGERAAAIEINTINARMKAGFTLAGITSGSDKVRYEFRKGILDRYVVPVSADEWTRDSIADQRKSLHAAYYAQPQIFTLINATPEVPGFDAVETVEDTSYSIPELVSA